jgi:hypothetical protein
VPVVRLHLTQISTRLPKCWRGGIADRFISPGSGSSDYQLDTSGTPALQNRLIRERSSFRLADPSRQNERLC